MDPVRAPVSPPLVGRERLREELRRAVDDAMAGRVRVVLLAGEPGIGKTALAAEAAAHAAARGAAVAWGACWEEGGGQGFWPWTQVIRALPGDRPVAADLAVLSGSVDPAGPAAEPSHGDRLRLFAGVADALRSAGQPVMVVLDDLQWADAASLRLLEFLARQLREARLLLVGTYRDVEIDAGHPLRGLLAALSGDAEVRPLTGLTAAEVGELLGRLGVPLGPAEAAAVSQRTGGNPFFVQQVARLQAVHDVGRSRPSGRDTAVATVPAAVGEVIARRFARLPNRTATLLATAAVVGTEFDAAVLAAAAGLTVGEVAEALEPAVEARVLAPTVLGGYRFEHDLFRETLYVRQGRAARAHAHLAVARALEARRTVMGRSRHAELALHYARALPEGPADRAVDHAVRAAREAGLGLAYEQAVQFWRQAIRISELAQLDVPSWMWLELADAQRYAGDTGAARVAYQAAATGDGAPEVLGRAALGLHLLGTQSGEPRGESIALLERAVTALEPAGPSGLAARVLAALAREVADGPDKDESRARVLVEAAQATAYRCGDPAALAFALFAKHDVIWAPGTAGERLALAGDMARAASEAGAADLVFEAGFCRFIALVELGDPLGAVVLDELERLAAQLRQPRHRYRVLSRQATLALLAGRYDQAQRLIDEAAALAAAINEPDGAGVEATQLLALGLARRGPVGLVAAVARTGTAALPAELAPQRRAFAHLARGEPAAAAAILRAGPPRAGPTEFRWRALAWAAFDLEIATAAGAADECAARYEDLLPYAEQMVVIGGAVAVLGPVSLYLGLAAGTLGRLDDAVSHLRAALAVGERLAARPLAARARVELGAVLARRGRPDDLTAARELLVAAAEVADELDLEPVRDRARAALTTIVPGASQDSPAFSHEGEIWTLTFAGSTVQVRDAKGLHDLAALLAMPGRDIPASRLLAGPGGPVEPATGSDEVLDQQARAAYKARLGDLDEEIADAEADHDDGRLARLRDERDALIEELARAYGLGGRVRRLGDPGERARTTVTARIRESLRRIERVHPQLAVHLRGSVRTGRSCGYHPVQPVAWRL